MQSYHWILLVFFTLPYLGTKIYNERRYKRNIYWLGMNRAEIILSTLPITLSSITIHRYNMTFHRYNIMDRYYFIYFIFLIVSFLHSIKKYEEVKTIIEVSEMELNTPKKVESKEIKYNDSTTGDSAWSPNGGGGGSGYTTKYEHIKIVYSPYNDPSNTTPDMRKFYNCHYDSSNHDYIARKHALRDFERQHSYPNGSLFNYYHEKKLDEIYTIIKRICPNVKIGYESDIYDYTKCGLIFDLGGDTKLKYVHYLEYWYFWDAKKEIWMQLVMNDELMAQLEKFQKEN